MDIAESAMNMNNFCVQVWGSQEDTGGNMSDIAVVE